MLNQGGELFVFCAKMRSFMIPRLTEALRNREIVSSDVSTLLLVHDQPGCSIKDICVSIAADKGRQTNVVQRLIDLGILENRSTNRRTYSLYLTEKGMEEHDFARKALNKLNDDLMINLTDRQKETFMKLMGKIEEIADLGYRYRSAIDFSSSLSTP